MTETPVSQRAEEIAAAATPASSAPWHALDAPAALEALASAPAGLSSAEAAERLKRAGPNALPTQKRRGLLARIAGQLNNVLIYVLLAAALIALALQHWLDAIAILAVVAINAVIGVVQEGRAEQALDAIRDMLAPEATVLRDGVRTRLPSQDIAPGDVVLLEAGDRVPADLRLITARGLTIDESILTGESLPIHKALATLEAAAPLPERANMAHSGTLVRAGAASGVVVATGAATQLGRISTLVAGAADTASPLIRRMNQFATSLTATILGLCAVVFVVAIARAYPFDVAFLTVVSLAVAAVPEGLPAILTIILALGALNMARRNAIVRRMPAIEALGAVTIICSDKTGTFTENELTVASALHDGADVRELALAALLASDAHVSDGVAVGDPMDVAVLRFAEKHDRRAQEVRPAHPRLDAIPFDAAHRFTASLNRWPDGRSFAALKGAPEAILAMCDAQRDGAHDAPLDAEYWRARIEELARGGQRVIAVALKEQSPALRDLDFPHVERGCTLIGLIGLEDPPKAEAVDAVRDCRSAGIRVKMITGDHAVTARAIAARLGLENPHASLEGVDLDDMTEDEFAAAAENTDVFARVTPEHKLRLVEALQSTGAIVAMTGDGVNDAPALKRADVGLAMGRRGSDAAKEASDIVLADDNFATIARAVRAGRTIYDNLRKVILFELPTNGGEALVVVGAILAGATLPVTPLQILWINMVTTVLLALVLAFEPPEPGVMLRPPRPPKAPLLSNFLIWRIGFVSVIFAGGVFALFQWSRAQGHDVETARTVAVNALVVFQIFYLFSTRYLHGVSLTLRGVVGTRAVFICVGGAVLLQFLFTYAPPFQALFDTRPLTLYEGLAIAAAGMLLLLIMEIDKAIYLLRKRLAGATHSGAA